jgi:hypothetical protein
VSAVDGDDKTVTCDDGWFGNAEEDPKLRGAVVTVMSGAAKGQRRLIAAADGPELTIDSSYYGGWFSPVPAVGDVIMVGGFDSYWRTPRLSVNSVGQKRFAEAVVKMGPGGPFELRQTTWARGRELDLGRAIVPAGDRDQATVALRGAGENWQGECGTTGPAQPWQLDGLTIIAQQGGETR